MGLVSEDDDDPEGREVMHLFVLDLADYYDFFELSEFCLKTVPVEYFCPLDANGKRRDADERPELCKGSVEFVASTEYMVRPPMPPVYFFLIDVSLSAIRNGMLQVMRTLFPHNRL